MDKQGNASELEWWQFRVKYAVLAISALWALYAGTDLISKESAALELRNKKLGVESIPLAKPSIDYTFDNSPWLGQPALCTVTGQYRIKNVGSLPIIITKVTFDVYDNKTLTPKDMGDEKVTSFTLSAVINNTDPIYEEEFDEFSKIDVGQSIERSFGYVIKREAGHLYSINANAEGGLASVDGDVDSDYEFGKNELRINTGFKSICGGDQTMSKD